MATRIHDIKSTKIGKVALPAASPHGNAAAEQDLVTNRYTNMLDWITIKLQSKVKTYMVQQ